MALVGGTDGEVEVGVARGPVGDVAEGVDRYDLLGLVGSGSVILFKQSRWFLIAIELGNKMSRKSCLSLE